MKKLFILVLAVATLTSCVTTRYFDKHKNEICDLCPDSVIIKQNIIHTESIDTIYRVSSIDSMIIAAGILSGLPANITTDTIRIVDKVFDASIWIENSRLKANIKHLNDTIDKIVIKNNTTINNDEKKTQTITKTVIKKAGRFYVWFFWIVVILLVLWIILKLWLSKYVKALETLFNNR